MDAMPPDADRPRAGPGRAGQLVGRGRDLQAQAGRRLLDARDEHVTIKLLTDALREDRDTGGALLAGALAFRLFLWLLPACLVVVALLGFSNADEVGRDLTGAGLGGFTASTIAQATAQAHQGRWFLLLVGAVALYSTSVGLAKAMWIGTSLAWHLPVSRLRRPPRAAGAVVALLLPAVALTLAANWLRSVAYPIGLVVTLLMLVLYALFGWFILSVLPTPGATSVTDLLPGALLIGRGRPGPAPGQRLLPREPHQQLLPALRRARRGRHPAALGLPAGPHPRRRLDPQPHPCSATATWPGCPPSVRLERPSPCVGCRPGSAPTGASS